MELSKEALKARAEYQRQWKKANKEKVKAAQMRYWEKIAAMKTAERSNAVKQ